MTEYPDSNGNGVPDAFENRAPIVDILNRDPASIAQNVNHIDPFSLDRRYRLFVGPLFKGKAVLLEVETVSSSAQHGACVFDSREELREFIRQLEMAGAEAFGAE